MKRKIGGEEAAEESEEVKVKNSFLGKNGSGQNGTDKIVRIRLYQ